MSWILFAAIAVAQPPDVKAATAPPAASTTAPPPAALTGAGLGGDNAAEFLALKKEVADLRAELAAFKASPGWSTARTSYIAPPGFDVAPAPAGGDVLRGLDGWTVAGLAPPAGRTQYVALPFEGQGCAACGLCPSGACAQGQCLSGCGGACAQGACGPGGCGMMGGSCGPGGCGGGSCGSCGAGGCGGGHRGLFHRRR